MYIVNGKLTIRNATSEDAQMLCNWWNNGDIMAHAGFPNGLGTTRDAVIDKISSDTDDTRRRLIIEVDSNPIGEMSYSNIGIYTAEIGIKICNIDKQEKGHGTQFIKMLVRELFLMGYEKIILDTNLNNKRAQHVYEKIGFRKVGVRENAFVDQLGLPQSAVDYELLRTNFKYMDDL